MDPSHWIDSFFGFEKDKSKKKKTIHLVGENCPAKLPFITSVINYVFNVKFGDTFRFQLDIQRADSTYRYFSDFSGPFVPCWFFVSAANSLSRFDDSNGSCCANFELLTPSSELLDTVIENNIGEVTHVIVVSYPAQGICLKGLWVHYWIWFSSLGGSHSLSKKIFVIELNVFFQFKIIHNDIT